MSFVPSGGGSKIFLRWGEGIYIATSNHNGRNSVFCFCFWVMTVFRLLISWISFSVDRENDRMSWCQCVGLVCSIASQSYPPVGLEPTFGGSCEKSTFNVYNACCRVLRIPKIENRHRLSQNFSNDLRLRNFFLLLAFFSLDYSITISRVTRGTKVIIWTCTGCDQLILGKNLVRSAKKIEKHCRCIW